MRNAIKSLTGQGFQIPESKGLAYNYPMNTKPVNQSGKYWLIQPTNRRDRLVAARIPAALEEELEAERQRRGVPKSEVIFLALQEFLGKQAKD